MKQKYLLMEQIENIITAPQLDDDAVSVFKIVTGSCVSFRCPDCMRNDLKDRYFSSNILGGATKVLAMSSADFDAEAGDRCSGCDRYLYEISEDLEDARMPVYKCPNKNCDSKEFSAWFYVRLNVNDEGIVDKKSFCTTSAELDSYSMIDCKKCGHSDCELAFEI